MLVGGFGAASVVQAWPIGTATVDVPMVLPAAAFAFLPCFTGFMAFTVMSAAMPSAIPSIDTSEMKEMKWLRRLARV